MHRVPLKRSHSAPLRGPSVLHRREYICSTNLSSLGFWAVRASRVATLWVPVMVSPRLSQTALSPKSGGTSWSET